ncbi:MAG: infB [Candidatus Peribacteria bacterium]|nr:infB [Candidatus Peribacteria bacterium]
MRLVQIAKALNMTGQELRKELMQVNFGVKPTDREVPEGLAKGIIRFMATKYNIQVNMEELGLGDGEPQERKEEVKDDQGETEDAASSGKPGSVAKDAAQADASLNVLRKLSLEGVSKDAIARQAPIKPVDTMTRAEREEQEREEKILRQQQAEKKDATLHQQQIKRKEGMVSLPDQISVKEFAEKTGIQVPKIIQTLMKNGVMATITQSIDFDTAAIVAAELGVDVKRELAAAKSEDLFSRNLADILKDDTENLVTRPPIVVIMGHVDHGKTALLDAIRHTNVVAGEAGGITQHIGAYQVEHEFEDAGIKEMRKITFLDTPGHEAFTAMRARGAQVTDIAIIVVSAEESVRPTTIEAINHAKEAGVSIIVAITKVDKERADIDRVKGDMATHGLQPEEWGGDTPFVLTSAVTRQGLDDLLDTILLIAELKQLKVNPTRLAVATVIESHLDTSLGSLATLIVNAGTLRVGDVYVCGQVIGKVKTLMDAQGKRLKEVGPSGAVRVSGFDGVPQVGDILQVVPSEKQARVLMDAFKEQSGRTQKRSFADLVTRLTEGKLTQLKLVLKTDTQGSLDAIQEALRKQTEGSTDLSVKVIHGAIGAVSESDVMMAAASEAVVMAFHSNVSSDVLRTADREGVQVRQYTIVYELLDEVDRLLKGLIEPVEEEKILGHLEVRGVFLTKRSEQIIGGKVTDGSIKRVAFRLQRGGEQVGTGRILSLKHIDKDIKEAKEGSECGMRIESSMPVIEGDVLEAYHRELKKREEK